MSGAVRAAVAFILALGALPTVLFGLLIELGRQPARIGAI